MYEIYCTCDSAEIFLNIHILYDQPYACVLINELMCWILLMPLDGEGRGGPEALQVPQGEAGQRVLAATWRPQTEVRAAGLRVSNSLCNCSWLLCSSPSSPSSCYLHSIISEHSVYWRQLTGDWHPFGAVLLFLPSCSVWLISHDKGHVLD